MESCLYEGRVRHRRHAPVTHQFQYSLYMAYLDLDELSAVVGKRGVISAWKYAPVSFQRENHTGDAKRPLADSVRDVVEAETGRRPRGPIRLLTQLRYFGYYFSPLNIYYCFDETGRQVETVVSEVNNIPWREQRCYVLWNGNRRRDSRGLLFEHDKDFHVSPFMQMDMRYVWRLSEPSEKLCVDMQTLQDGRSLFDATMTLDRRPLSRGQLLRCMLRFPLMTVQIVSSIYFQALRLWWKKCPSYPHPKDVQTPQLVES